MFLKSDIEDLFKSLPILRETEAEKHLERKDARKYRSVVKRRNKVALAKETFQSL